MASRTLPTGELEARRAFLRELPLFAEVPRRIVEECASQMGDIDLRRGRLLFAEGDSAQGFFLIRRGWIKIIRETAPGRSVLFEILRPGETVGTVALVNEIAYPVTAVAASTPTEVLCLPGKHFLQLLHQHSGLLFNYSKEVGLRLAEARKWQVQVAYTMEGRIAQLFLRLADRMGEPQGGGAIVLPRLLTRQEVADMVGTTVETAIRTLSHWNKSGLLVSEKDRFVINRRDELARLAQST